MKLSRRHFLKSTAVAAVAISTSALLGCEDDAVVVKDDSSTTTTTATAAPTAEPEVTPEPTPELPYYADMLTGFERDPDETTYRVTGVMINNIAGSTYQNARPQRGLSSASVIIEIKVEGGITRFCALFNDLADMPEIGPIRSGRDQFLQMVMPYEGVYYHDGESYYCTLYVYTWEYSMYNFGGKTYTFDVPTHSIVAHRDSRDGNVAYEHTEFTSGEEVQQAVDNAGVVMEREYENTFLKFADYRTDEYVTLDDGEEGTAVTIHHSDSYRSYFDYDESSKKYLMGQYSPAIGGTHITIDELTNEQLGFTNVFALFTTIEAYPGDSGDVQYVDYTYGGTGYYFTNGKAKYIYWLKGSPTAPLCIVDPEDSTDYTINMGNTYIAIIGHDQYDNFKYDGGKTIAAQ